VLTGAAAVAELPLGDLLGEAHTAGLSVVRVPDLVPRISPGRDLAALRSLTRVLAAGDFDVVHTHTSKAGALGRLAASRLSPTAQRGDRSGGGPVRIVHTFHGLPFHRCQPVWRRGLYLGIERWLGRRTDAFLAVGGAVAAEAVRRGVAAADRIRVIAPAVDPAPPVGPGSARRRLGLPPGVRVVGTVGRIDHQKAPEEWVDAVAAAGGDAWGVWIGDGPLRDRLLARVRDRGLAERFRWLGHRTDVARLLPAFDVFALASRYEGQPCVVVEAMQARVPVVATAVDAVPELVVAGETGMLAPPGRPDLLGRAIGHLLDSPAEARRMAATAASRLGDRFTAGALGTILDQTYRGATDAARVTSRPRGSR
jgi:glycosyltransferase involved in cell wall biosynthesis